MDVIFLPTVRHSGTWFLQKLFQTGGFKVVNLDRMLFGGEHIPANTKAVNGDEDGSVRFGAIAPPPTVE